ncbi:MAG TPA: hypothetical protein VI815_00180 [Candidatus Nanoarchaeia archaeon]|nr:hypothetical protein [Candidatus Nanoarchaeia archaeon]
MEIKNTLKSMLLSGALALGTIACDATSEIVTIRDLTGDGIEDVIIYTDGNGARNFRYLFIGQEDGTYIRAKEITESSGVSYFLTDSGDAYFSDGELYKLVKEDKKD